MIPAANAPGRQMILGPEMTHRQSAMTCLNVPKIRSKNVLYESWEKVKAVLNGRLDSHIVY